ncbi:MAG: ABC transporter permease [Nitrososphaerota archaeon]
MLGTDEAIETSKEEVVGDRFQRLRGIQRRYSKSYLLKRITSLLIVFFAVLILIFFLPRLMPGNYVLTYIHTLEREHPGVNAKLLSSHIKSLFGFGQPLYVQFLIYLKNIFSLSPNFGPSFEYYPIPAWTVVGFGIYWTLLLLGSSQAVAWTVGIFLGTFLSFRKGKIADRVAQPFFYFLNSMPSFWVAMIFILIFAVDLRAFPASGAYALTPTFSSVLYHMFLPMIVIVIVSLPSHTLVIRAAAVETLGSDFTKSLKAQGFSNFTVLKRVMKNSLLPSITYLMLNIGYLIGGIYTVEITFSYPGMGTIIADAILAEDYPVIEASLYITTLVILLANLAADLLYPLIDPRVSYSD